MDSIIYYMFKNVHMIGMRWSTYLIGQSLEPYTSGIRIYIYVLMCMRDIADCQQLISVPRHARISKPIAARWLSIVPEQYGIPINHSSQTRLMRESRHPFETSSSLEEQLLSRLSAGQSYIRPAPLLSLPCSQLFSPVWSATVQNQLERSKWFRALPT